MKAKIQDVINNLQSVSETIDKNYSDGVVHGFSEQPISQGSFQTRKPTPVIIMLLLHNRATRSEETLKQQYDVAKKLLESQHPQTKMDNVLSIPFSVWKMSEASL